MSLTLSDVAKTPSIATSAFELPSGEQAILRPLETKDAKSLAAFLENLSPQTRLFYDYPSYDLAHATEMCEAINRYDKLRLILCLKSTGRIIGIFEFSFDIPEGDQERFSSYGITPGPDTCCLGPCLADDYQDKGIGSIVLPYLINIARDFGKRCVILWGGVRTDNERGIRFYEKNGFKRLGTFLNQTGDESLDMILEI